jgi:hypothetical protein
MAIKDFGLRQYAFALVAAAAITAGCSTGSAPSMNSGVGTQPQTRNGAHSLVFVRTNVRFKNAGSTTISGSGSSTCWSISTPLPFLSGGQLSSTIELGYDTTCIGGSDQLDISYGPASGPDCTFVTTYDAGFTYQAVNSELTACTATASGNPTFDELYTYAPIESLRKHR